jgi:hypothetical protein
MPPSALSIGFRTVLRRPSLFLMEVAWRWGCGLAAILAVLYGGSRLSGIVRLSEADAHAWRSRDFFLMTQAALHFLYQLRGQSLVTAAAVVLSVSALWVFLNAAGRTLILRQLVHAQVSFPRVLGLHVSRLLVGLVTLAGLVGAAAFSVSLATRGRIPDYMMFYVLFTPLLVTLTIFWSVLNWYFSLGAVCVAQYRSRNTSSGKLTLFFLSGRMGEVLGLTFLFGAMRFTILLVLFVLAVLPTSLIPFTPIWPVSLGLAYLLMADFLHICRLASYLSLESYASAAPGVVTFEPQESAHKMTVRIKL